MVVRGVAVVAVGMALAMHAQTPAIRVEAREVLVDVTVTGRKGAAPGTLAARDFAIWEDGRPQKINGLSKASADPEAALKHFVVYLDFNTMSTADQAASKQYAEKFIAGVSSPDRYIAVATLNSSGPRVLQNFTTAQSALTKAVDLSYNARVFSGVSTQQVAILNPQMVAGGAVSPLAASLTAVAESMAPAAGRKAVVLFTGGYPGGESSPAIKAAITACNRANVAVYVVAGRAAMNPGGLNANASRLPYRGTLDPSAQTTSGLADLLADATGGEVLALSEKLPEQLAAVAREQDEYYRIAYTPPPAKEGSCHTLRVKVNIRGLGARARNEYCTERPVDLVAGRIAGEGLESRTAGAGRGALGASMQLPYFYTGSNRASVHLTLEVVPRGMKFQKDRAGLHGEIDLVGTASRADGGTAARFADTVKIDAEDQQRADAFTGAPYHYEHQFTVAAGQYRFQMAIGVGPDAAGKVEMPLDVPPWTAASFGMGGIAFSTEAQAVDPASPVGGPILEGRTPLVALGRRFVPAATSRFQRSAPLYFYTEVYDPALGGAGLTMEYRVLDRQSGEVRQDTGMAGVANYVRPGNPVVPFATRLPLAQLPAGEYRLEVLAGHAGSGQTVARTVDFELN